MDEIKCNIKNRHPEDGASRTKDLPVVTASFVIYMGTSDYTKQILRLRYATLRMTDFSTYIRDLYNDSYFLTK